MPLNADDGRHNRRNAPTRYTTDWDAYDRIQWQREDTLDSELRTRRIPAHLLNALCARVDAPKLRRAA